MKKNDVNIDNSIVRAITHQSKKEMIVFQIVFGIIFTIFLVYTSYLKFFIITNNVVNIGASNIYRSLVNGDEFSIKSELASLTKQNGFYDLWVTDNTGYIISNNTKSKMKNYLILNKDFILFLQNWKMDYLIIRKFELPMHSGSIYIAMKFNLLIVIMKYILLFLLIYIFSYLLLIYRIKIYKNLTDSIVQLSYLLKNDLKEFDEKLNPKKTDYLEIIHLYENINEFMKKIKENESYKIKISQLSSVVNTIQMLAHDIRKPFLMLNVVLDKFENIKSLNEVYDFSQKSKLEIRGVLNKVTGMLYDIMHFGDRSKIEHNNFSFEPILERSIFQCLYPNSTYNIEFEYEFNHNSFLFYSSIKFDRILTNLITNAYEAMNFNGKIWIKTKNIQFNNLCFIEFRFGNNNSFLPNSLCEEIFELHSTFGKLKGNGIGLFIVKKFVEEVGGTINCYSDNFSFVEFVFTLPSGHSSVVCKQDFKLPVKLSKERQNSNDLHSINNNYSDKKILNNNINSNHCNNLENVENIVIIDDDEIYLTTWKTSMSNFNVLTFENPESFIQHSISNRDNINTISIIIVDYFYRGIKMNIIEMNFVDALRSLGYKNKCILSTSAICTQDELTVFDGFIDKSEQYYLQLKYIHDNKMKNS